MGVEEQRGPTPWWNVKSCFRSCWTDERLLPWAFLIQGLKQWLTTRVLKSSVQTLLSVACSPSSGELWDRGFFPGLCQSWQLTARFMQNYLHLWWSGGLARGLSVTGCFGNGGDFHPSCGWKVSSSLGWYGKWRKDCPRAFLGTVFRCKRLIKDGWSPVCGCLTRMAGIGMWKTWNPGGNTLGLFPFVM